MGEARDIKRASRVVFSVFIAIALLYVVFIMPLPLYIFKPGTAEDINPMVHIKQASEEKGKFMLTTVQVADATVFGYLMSYVRPYEELRLKRDLLRNNESEAEYSRRQEVVMLTSQADAIQAVYNRLKIPYHISKDGVVIQQVYPDVPAHDVLQAGDTLVKIDDKPIQSMEEVRGGIKGKKAGETVLVSYKRKDVIQTKDIALAALPVDKKAQPADAAPAAPQVGLGVVLAELHSVKPGSEEQQVTIKAGDIGGPSAGLMFSLEIYNRLAPGDITKGYKVAGTGEIDPEGHVGVIGGIQHKIVAADRAGAEIFFSPADYKAPTGQTIPNYSDAKKRAEELGTKMTVVPVATMAEALDYLAKLPAKTGS
ncbi:SepM family pheromone-processing serine protease [Paenibacillus sp. MZ04-78.2]|uniref:SepM family pheromone-processing serine protease n=1 Tax=Paenibacillus sp. MZ04-78.2 TaxID=2962034 RepID=UPI00265D61E3|nr:SepM family pheromone-processing serine protease [Paenibacillus sp. MZ04-78.2]